MTISGSHTPETLTCPYETNVTGMSLLLHGK